MSWVPGRVNVIGEHTDYNGGPSLAFAIDRGVTATATRRDDRRVTVTSAQAVEPVVADLDQLAPGSVAGWAAYVLGVVWAMRERLEGGLDIAVDGDVPPGAGLSSSAALTGATAAAVDDAFGLAIGIDDLVDLAISAERSFVGIPVGGLDQRVAGRARPGHAVLHDGASGTTQLVPMRAPCSFMVIPLAGRHELADGRYAARRARCEALAGEIGVPTLAAVAVGDLGSVESRLDPEAAALVRHVVTETDRVRRAAQLLSDPDADTAALGHLVTQSHCSLRDDFSVSTPEADALVSALLADGVLGARLIGGGDGGSVLAVVDPSDGDARGGFFVAPTGEWRRR